MFSLEVFSKCIVESLTDIEVNNSKIISINNKSLSVNGDLSFPLEINHWRGYVSKESNWFKSLKTILDYYDLKKNDGEILAKKDTDFLLPCLKEDVLARYKQTNGSTSILDFQFKEHNNFISVIFDRNHTSYEMVKTVIDQGSQYGKQPNNKEIRFYFKVDCEDSEMTKLRLKLIKKTTENLLGFQGYSIQNEECDNNFILTTKSEGKINAGYNKYLCGSVLNIHKKKEKVSTEDMYKKIKTEKVKILNSKRCLDIQFNMNDFEKDIHKITNATVVYELLSTNHVSPIVVEVIDDSEKSIKEASFILYNYARMVTILKKYDKLFLKDKFPAVLPIENMRSFCKVTDDESWALIYNYILKYPDLLKSAVTIKPKLYVNISLVWSFVSNLCHDFSKYYRRSRILIKGAESNSETLQITSEKLHMVKALKIILKNSLSLLDIQVLASM